MYSIFSSLGLCPWRVYVVTQLLTSAFIWICVSTMFRRLSTYALAQCLSFQRCATSETPFSDNSYWGICCEWDYILYVLILSTSHDTWCPHSCMTAQKVPYPAPLCPQILAGALLPLPYFTPLYPYLYSYSYPYSYPALLLSWCIIHVAW